MLCSFSFPWDTRHVVDATTVMHRNPMRKEPIRRFRDGYPPRRWQWPSCSRRGGAQFLPFLIVGLPTGAIVARLRHKRRLLVVADVARAVTLASVPAAYAVDALSFEQLYAVASSASHT